MLAYIYWNAQYKKMFIVKCCCIPGVDTATTKAVFSRSVPSTSLTEKTPGSASCVVIGNVASFKARDSIEVSVTVGNPKAKM